MALPDAESYAQAHADSNYFPCPSCSEPVPRGGSYCPSCGIHCESMIPHRLAGLDAEHEATMKALGAPTSSAGRQPATSAHRRQQMIDRFTQTPGTSGPSLEEAFAVNDRVLAAAEREADRCDEQLRGILSDKFRSAAGASLTDAVKDARLIASRLGTSRAGRADVDLLMEAFAEWQESSAALSAARKERSALLDRHRHNGLHEPKD